MSMYIANSRLLPARRCAGRRQKALKGLQVATGESEAGSRVQRTDVYPPQWLRELLLRHVVSVKYLIYALVTAQMGSRAHLISMRGRHISAILPTYPRTVFFKDPIIPESLNIDVTLRVPTIM